ncbi:hypothetical protein PHLH7_26320 [Pseudomonas sp. Ost2]|uniref:hypothetical protein n=1 Tax=Pseudomonas sp. Ost2 TaxID=2678260 RepID=UPI001BB39E16|nr:hypothetical protein [Pseudomonas sp. Ost2]BBP76528.1 hypothetical protein PHLH7_26320 [Pseudomonas sp. Ost2]
MTIEQINIGSAPNDGAGQNLRSGGQVINANFAELDTRTAAAQARAEKGVADAATAQAKANAAVPGSAVGVSVAQLVDGVVPAAQLPSFVDDVLEFTTRADFPATGESGKIYIAINDGDSPSNPTRQWRWSGTAYVVIPSSPGSTDQVPEGPTNLYFTAARVRSTVLSGLGALVNAAVLASDTILQAFAKLQGQINAKLGVGDTAADSAKLNGQAASFYTATMTGATASGDGVKGLVPAPPAGAAVRVLSSLGTWISQANGGVWGAITGNLTDQVDLKAVLDSKLTSSVVSSQTPKDVTASRAIGTTYTNTDPFRIEVEVIFTSTSSGQLAMEPTTDGVSLGQTLIPVSASGFRFSRRFTVQPGKNYSVSPTGSSATPALFKWTELRT